MGSMSKESRFSIDVYYGVGGNFIDTPNCYQDGRCRPCIRRCRIEAERKETAMSAALDKVAKEVGAKHVTAVAIVYVMQKTPYVFPIIGVRRVEQWEANVEALEIVLSPEHIKYLERFIPLEPGFPFTLIGDGSNTTY